MIPKIIHYCWFSGEEMPPFTKMCLKSWQKKMPDYKLRLWDANSFDFNTVPFVREAYKAKKWAFVTDYIRLYALYTEGGIYMDTDVKVFKPFDDFLNNDFFSALEVQPAFFDKERNLINENYTPVSPEIRLQGINIQAAIMGSMAGHPYLEDCLNYYNTLSFDSNNTKSFIIGPHISKIAEKYGFKYKDSIQHLRNNMTIYDKYTIVGNLIYDNKNCYAVHLCDGSWKESHQTKLDKFRRKHPYLSKIISFYIRAYYYIRRKQTNNQ